MSQLTDFSRPVDVLKAGLLVAGLAALAATGCTPEQDDDDPVLLADTGGGADTGIGDDAGTDTLGPDTATDPDTGPPGDTGIDTAADGGDTGDGGETGPDDAPLDPLPDCQNSTPTAAGEPSKIETGEWSKAVLSSGDALINDIMTGQFQVPAPFSRKYGQIWNSATPQDDGTVHSPVDQRALVFIAKEFEVDSPTVYLANAQQVFDIYVNGARVPADIYGHGDKRIPISLEKGTNTVVLRGAASRKAQIEMYETDDAVYFNKMDTTTPDLRVGRDTAQPVGVPVANLAGRVLRDVEATVVENDHFKPTTVEYPSLAADGLTQLSWRLEPKKKWSKAGETISVTLRLETCSLPKAWETTIELKTVAPDATFTRTFRSPHDGSTQYYGVVPPSNYSPMKNYGAVLSLHGAGVDDTAGAYSQHDWAYIIASTNRRRYGFDWEEWGRLNGLAALDDASEHFGLDETRLHVSGHSMGGHGTWHFGVMHPGKFATIGPSAGWASFYTYPPGRTSKPDEPLQSARAHSETLSYLENLANRPVFVVHGTADRNVPIDQAKTLLTELKNAVPDKKDIQKHYEQGADHWWDGDQAEGTDCVEWPAMFDMFKNNTLDPFELDFTFKSPGPYYSASHSYATIRSRTSPMEPARLVSERTAMDTVKLTTTNVRSIDIDGQALDDKDIAKLVVEGVADTTQTVETKTMTIGPSDGKKPGQTGPINQVFQKPFCFVYMNDGSRIYRDLAAQLVSTWNIRGNGHACALPLSLVDEELRQDRNLVYLGVPSSKLPHKDALPYSRQSGTFESGQLTVDNSMSVSVYPQGDGMGLHIDAAEGYQALVRALFFSYQPFSSRSGMPDFLVYDDQGAAAFGFWAPDWTYDPSFAGTRN